jgi:hypothetical protein
MKCPACGSKVNGVDVSCRACGMDLSQLNLLADYTNKKKFILKIVAIASVVMLVIASLIIVKGHIDSNNRKAAALAEARVAAEELRAENARIQKEKADYSWVPKGYYKFTQDYNLAWKTIGYDAANCYETCWGVRIKANEYCSSLTIKTNIERNGTILDYTSDTAYDVSPEKQVIMKFQSSFDTPWNAVVTDISCT